MTAQDHGSISTYSNHKCRCDACKAAWAAYCQGARQRRARALAEGRIQVEHGLETTYGNYGCRCRACTDAWAEATTARRRRARFRRLVGAA